MKVQRLRPLQQAASGGHLQLLQSFADSAEGVAAPVAKCLEVLQELRKQRDVFAEKSAKSPSGPKLSMQQWTEECRKHTGMALLRQNLLAADTQKSMDNAQLSRAYNQFCRLGLTREAKDLWPTVSSRIQSQNMTKAKELLGIWSVTPPANLPELDAPLSNAFRSDASVTWQMLSAMTRASECEGSKTVLRCADTISSKLRDLSDEDLALIAGQMGASAQTSTTSVPPPLVDLGQRAKSELLERGGKLGTLHLCGLFRCMAGVNDKMWPMVRNQLLTKKDLSAQQTLQVCRFLQQAGGSNLDPQLFNHATQQLNTLLNIRAQPGLVAMVAQNLDSILPRETTVKCLLNAALALRQDLFPAVLWKLFTRAAEVNLLGRYPVMKNRLTRIGVVLEGHAFGQKKSLKEMVDIADAMVKNGIVLNKCLDRITPEFVEVLQGITGTQQPAATARVGVQEVDAKADAGSVPDVDAGALLAKAQRLAISYWVRLQKLGISEDESLRAYLETICSESGGGSKLDGMLLTEAIQELQGVDAAGSLQPGLAAQLAMRLPSISGHDLARTSEVVSSDAIRKPLTAEVIRRLALDRVVSVSTLRRGEDFDDAVAILVQWTKWLHEPDSLGGRPPVHLETIVRLAQLVLESLPAILEREPEAARNRLLITSRTFAAFEADESIPLCVFRQGLQSEVTKMAHAWEPTLAAELAFTLAALLAPRLTLDLVTWLWKIAGSVVTPSDEAASLSEQHAAQICAFVLATRHLCSPSLQAALRLAPAAPVLEAYVAQSLRKANVCFKLPSESTSDELLAQLRLVLPDVFPGKAWQESRAVPATPYIVDMIFPEQRVLLLVPRLMHRAVGSSNSLSAPGRLMEQTLTAMGWQLHWLWPESWSARLALLAGTGKNGKKEEATQALLGLLGANSAVAATTAIKAL
jgi:hypothetical protein